MTTPASKVLRKPPRRGRPHIIPRVRKRKKNIGRGRGTEREEDEDEDEDEEEEDIIIIYPKNPKKIKK